MFIFSYTRIFVFSHWNLTACFWKTCIRLRRPVLFSLSRCAHSLAWDQLKDPQSSSTPPEQPNRAVGHNCYVQKRTLCSALSIITSARLTSGAYAVLKSNSFGIPISSHMCSTSWSRRHKGIGEDTKALAALISHSPDTFPAICTFSAAELVSVHQMCKLQRSWATAVGNLPWAFPHDATRDQEWGTGKTEGNNHWDEGKSNTTEWFKSRAST